MQIYASTLRETGETVLPMKAGIAAVLVNLVGNYILIFGKLGAPALGVVGAAIATVISRYVECLIVVLWTHMHKKRCPYILQVYKSPRIPAELVRKIIFMGLPLLVNELLWSGGMTMLNQCYSVRGLEVVSAMNISTTVSNVFFCAFFAMGNTVAIMIGQLLGAGRAGEGGGGGQKAHRLCRDALRRRRRGDGRCWPRQFQRFTTPLRRLSAVWRRSLLLVVAVHHAGARLQQLLLLHPALREVRLSVTFLFDSVYLWVLCVPLAFVLSRFTAMPILPLFIVIQLLDLVKAASGITSW